MPWSVTLQHAQQHKLGYKKDFFTLTLGPTSSEPHEICAEQNTGEAVWRKTPAGDEAAVVCPADASGTFPQLHPFYLLCLSIMTLTNKRVILQQA